MNTVTEFRTAVADCLREAGFKAFEYVHEKPVAPCVLVVPDDPYLVGGSTFGSFQIRLTVALIPAKGINKQRAEELDEMLVRAITALDTNDFDGLEVASPEDLRLNDVSHIGVRITVEADIKIKEAV